MSYKYLLDTDICIYIAKNRPQQVRKRMEKCEPGDLAMSVITCGELYLGAQKSVRQPEAFRTLKQLTDMIAILDLDESVSRNYGIIRASLEQQGTVIGANDLWIAAHAKTKNLILVTNNTREYTRIELLTVENWALDML